jgi:hypothetical protein
MTTPRSPNRFYRRELARALRAARDAGFDVARFEVDPISGRIVVMIDKNDAAARADDRNPWDEVA